MAAPPHTVVSNLTGLFTPASVSVVVHAVDVRRLLRDVTLLLEVENNAGLTCVL